MRVQFQSPDPEGAQWKLRAERQVRASLRRLRSLVVRVKVRLEDVNGPLPGVDKRCRMQVELESGAVTRVDAASRTWQQALDAAVSRLKQRVVVQLHRSAVIGAPTLEQQAIALRDGSICLRRPRVSMR